MVERIRNGREYNLKCHPLQELKIGEMVQVQNQVGPHPRLWAKTGREVETLGNWQYNVRIDGSNRVTRRNCRFLRRINPVVDTPCHSIPEEPPGMLDTIDNLTEPEVPGQWSPTCTDQHPPETFDTLPEQM